MGAIARRELGAYFVSPVGWVIATVLVPFVSLFFLLQVVFGEQASMDNVFSVIQFLMLFAKGRDGGVRLPRAPAPVPGPAPAQAPTLRARLARSPLGPPYRAAKRALRRARD